MSPTDSSACPLLDALRQETRPLHRQLEANSRMRELISSDLTLEAYGEILLRYHALIATIECCLGAYHDAWDHYAYDPNSRVKLPRIEQDLRTLNLEPRPPVNVLGTERLLTDSFPAMVGTLYVTEGSSLGGQVISRHLKQHLGLSPDNGAAYFNGYGPDTREHWRAFQNFLKAFASEYSEHEVVVHAANHAFKTFDRVMG